MIAPALIVVGCLIARNVRRIEWDDPTEALPAFLVMVGMPFTGSIADGIAFADTLALLGAAKGSAWRRPRSGGRSGSLSSTERSTARMESRGST